jgi:hypothetical protein
VVSGVAGGAIAAGMIARGQRSMARVTAEGRRDAGGRADVGRQLPGSSGETGAAALPRRWTGSARVPSAMGYVHVGALLAVLEVAPARLVLRVRPAIARVIFGVENLAVVPGDDVVIFLARKLGQQGIEARLEGRPSYYFWTDRRHEVLNSLAAAGFQVSEEEQRMRP